MTAIFYVIGRVVGYALRPAFRRYLESWSEARAELAGEPDFTTYADEACALTVESERVS